MGVGCLGLCVGFGGLCVAVGGFSWLSVGSLGRFRAGKRQVSVRSAGGVNCWEAGCLGMEGSERGQGINGEQGS